MQQIYINTGNRTGWPEPGYLEHENRGHVLMAICLSVTAFTACVVCLRMYTRMYLLRYVGKDDIMMCFAMACSIGMVSMQVYSCLRWGNYRHVWNLSEDAELHCRKMVVLLTTFYPYILGSIKISILFFYLRLSVSPTFRKVVYCMIAVMVCLSIASSLAILLQCTPLYASWHLHQPYHCVNRPALQYTVASLNISTDVFVLFLSWFMCMGLKISLREKIAVLGIFSVGGFVCVCSGLRFGALRSYWSSNDRTWVIFHASIFSCLEANLSICTASVPSIKPLLVKAFPALGTITGSSVQKETDFSDSTEGKESRQGSASKPYKHTNWDSVSAIDRVDEHLDITTLGVIPDREDLEQAKQ